MTLFVCDAVGEAIQREEGRVMTPYHAVPPSPRVSRHAVIQTTVSIYRQTQFVSMCAVLLPHYLHLGPPQVYTLSRYAPRIIRAGPRLRCTYTRNFSADRY